MNFLHANKTRIILIALVMSQVIVMLWFGMHKKGFHVDEIFSYGLSNSYFKPFLQSEPEFGKRLYSSYELQDYLVVNNDEKFEYASVIYNQEQGQSQILCNRQKRCK